MRSPSEVKPLYVDFDAPILVELLARLALLPGTHEPSARRVVHRGRPEGVLRTSSHLFGVTLLRSVERSFMTVGFLNIVNGVSLLPVSCSVACVAPLGTLTVPFH